MNIRETAQVMGTITAYTNRKADAAVITAWHALLEPYALQDCLQAIQDHYRDSRDWIMPSDVIGRARLIRAERLAKFPQHLRLSDQDEQQALESGTYRERMADLLAMAADGRLSPEAHAAYLDQDLTLDSLTRQELGR